MSKARPLVVGIGEILWDRFPDADRLGGAPSNLVFHAAQLGAASRIVSRIGRDADGSRLSDSLRERGMSLEYLQRDPVYPTGTVLVQLEDGQPRYAIKSPAAWDYLDMTEELKGLAARVDAVCFGSLAQRNAESRRTIQQFIQLCPAHAIRLFDINLRQSFYTREIIQFGLRHATVLKLNADELIRVAEIFGWKSQAKIDGRRFFQHFPLEMVAVTRGAEGCEIHTRARTISSAAPRVKCEDAVGAGDAFSAALLTGLLRKKGLEEIADRANRIGAYVASRPGAMVELPPELAA